MAFISALRAALGPQAVWVTDSERAAFERDWRGLIHNPALAVVFPRNPADVAEVVKICALHKVRIVPQGGNTSLVAGAVPIKGMDQVILSFSRMRTVREIDLLADSMTVEAGLTLADIQQEAAKVNRFFPVSLAAEGTAQIGGGISTNAGGMQVLSYGSMRAQILGLEVVLHDGQIWHGLSSLRKDNTGYDLKQLFIGAEGTLGLITAATLRLYPAIAMRVSALVGIQTLSQGLDFFVTLRRAIGTGLTLCEFCTYEALTLGASHVPNGRLPFSAPAYLLLEVSALAAEPNPQAGLEATLSSALESGDVLNAVITKSEQERRDLLALREAISVGELREGGAIKHDISVPLSALPQMVTQVEALVAQSYPGFRLNIFGHVGDGNLHMNVRPPKGQSLADIAMQAPGITQNIEALAMSLQGSFSAEHGVGQLRLAEMLAYKSKTDLALMQVVKRALDPHGLFNPGKTIPEA